MSDLLKKMYGIPEPWEDGLDILPDHAPSPNYDIGDTIGERYEVKEHLNGAMGDVFHCIDKRRNSEVALKTIISAGKTDRIRMVTFADEIDRVLRLPTHPNVVTLQRIEAVDGYFYLVTEWVRGHSEYGNTLTDWLKAKRFSCAEIVDFLQQLTCGLAHCHRHLAKPDRPYVYGDLKPDNILIDQNGTLKLGDFSGGHTPGWCAPEFSQSSRKVPDERSDIFGVARVAQEMAGRTEEIEGALYSALDELIGTCLEDDMDLRIQSLQGLKDKLSAICQQYSLTPYDEAKRSAAPFLDRYNRTVSAINMGYAAAVYDPFNDNARVTYSFAHGRPMSMNEYMEATSPVAKKLYHAKAFFLQGEHEKAMLELQGYTANSDILHLKASILRLQGRFDESINCCLSAVLLTDHLLSYDMIGTILLEQPGLFPKYQTVAQTLLHKLKAIPERRLTGYLPHQSLAKFHMLCGDLRYASSHFRKCLRFYNPGGDWFNLYLYGICELRQHSDGASAKHVFDAAIKQIKADPGYAKDLYKFTILFYCMNLAGNYADAAIAAKELNDLHGVDLSSQIAKK